MWITLNLTLSLKWKKRGMEIFAGVPRYRNWMTLVSWVMRSVRRRSHTKVNFFLVSGILSGKAVSVTLSGFESTVNLQNLINFVGTIFEKIEILSFFPTWTTLNFKGRSKTTIMARNICKRILDIEFERDRSISVGSTIGDGQTDRQTFF